jgi:hypothetical protein
LVEKTSGAVGLVLFSTFTKIAKKQNLFLVQKFSLQKPIPKPRKFTRRTMDAPLLPDQ